MSQPIAALDQAGAPSRLALPVFVVAIATSAFLLFGVQPMFAKMVLPLLGGSPGVWSVATVVFQCLLLAGYAYAHWLARHPVRLGALVHLSLMAAAAAMLPFAIGAGWREPPPDGEALWLVGLFLSAVGLPFMAIAGNGPLLQAWFSRSGHRTARDPYFLYSASNLGSFAALAAYPILIEPWLPLGGQSLAWAASFALMATLVAACAVLTGADTPAMRADQDSSAAPSARARAGWVAVSFVSSGLLVAATAHVSTDIAAMPLLWIAPLALYLFSFVLAFRARPFVSDRALGFVQAGATAIALVSLGSAMPLWPGLVLHVGLFFVVCLICHATLHRSRPPADRLTDFYLCLALGGALGGIFAGILAPKLFNTLLEYPLLLAAAFLCRPGLAGGHGAGREAGRTALGSAAAAAGAGLALTLGADPVLVRRVLLVALAIALIVGWRRPVQSATLALAMGCAAVLFQPGDGTSIRSFFGVHRVLLSEDGRFRLLSHGTTVHGAMRVKEDDGSPARGRPEPTTYYGADGAIAGAIESVRQARGGTLGTVSIVGLGAGSVACHARSGERWSFYEIDPEVARIARNPAWFRFLSDCAPEAPVVMGDARLTLAKSPAGQDVIVLDAFSSDAIPVHLLTREALGLYLSRLGPHGALVIHVSNRHLDLTRILARVGAEHGLATYTRLHLPDEASAARLRTGQIVVAMARDPADLGPLARNGEWRRLAPEMGRRSWTDDYSNILEALMDKARQ